jgi:hypothetical protein
VVPVGVPLFGTPPLQLAATFHNPLPPFHTSVTFAADAVVAARTPARAKRDRFEETRAVFFVVFISTLQQKVEKRKSI